MAGKGEYLICRAVQAANLEKCRRLIEVKGADVNEKDEEGRSPIVAACELCYFDIVKYLVSKGADINGKNNDGVSCLMWASVRGRVDVAEFLVSKGANINYKRANTHELENNGASCFSVARTNYHFKVLDRLRKWPTTMAILILQELALIYIIDSESVIDLHQYLGRPDYLKADI